MNHNAQSVAGISAAQGYTPLMYRLLLLLLLTLPACQRPPMVLPTMFAAGRVDPLADVPEAERTQTLTFFYATDRRYDEDTTDWRQFGRHRSGDINVGQVTVRLAPKGDWSAISTAARGGEGAKRYSPRMTVLNRMGRLDMPGGLPVSSADVDHEGDQNNTVTSRFIKSLDAALDRSPGKAITIFIHGFKTDFKDAALSASEYDLYTGGLGPFILYSWPSYDSLWEYSHDRDSARFTTGHARQFVALLADEIRANRLSAEKINFVAHSSGAEVVGSVLRELALMFDELSPEERRDRWRIGSVLLIAPDISTDVARERVLKEDLRGMYDEIVVYSSRRDRALEWASRMLYRTPRIGSIRETDLTEDDRYWLGQAGNVALIDIDSQPNEDFVHHSHHRFSAAVASDIILCLRSDLTPEGRGLERDEGKLIWRFADDYTDRVTEAAVRVYGERPTP